MSIVRATTKSRGTGQGFGESEQSGPLVQTVHSSESWEVAVTAQLRRGGAHLLLQPCRLHPCGPRSTRRHLILLRRRAWRGMGPVRGFVAAAPWKAGGEGWPDSWLQEEV